MNITLSADHVYRTDDGNAKVSVTQVLKAMGFGNSPYFTPFTADRGTKIHQACFMLCTSGLDWSSVDERIEPKCRFFQKFLDECGFVFEGGETPFYSHRLNIAGMPDLWGKIGGRSCVIDIKSGVAANWHKLQTALYRSILSENHIQTTDRYALYLTKSGYNLTKHDNPADSAVAEAMVIAYHGKKQYE